MFIYISNTSIEKALLYSLYDEVTRKQLNAMDFTEPQRDLKKSEKLQQFIQKHNIKRTTTEDQDYHFKLLQIPSKPQIIYYIGNIDILNQHILGIVGPRIATLYGKQVIHDLLDKAKHHKLVTISGLAEGIDTLCHEQSIANNIPTIAVLGGGIQYYLHNRSSSIEKIIGNGGLIISEFKIGFKPTNYSFPQRNRIIAGLSDMVFLPEASEKSGSLITVDFALKAGKKIYATPNDIYNIHSTGVNKYISENKIQAIYNLEYLLQSHFIRQDQATKQTKDTGNLQENEKTLLQFLESTQSTKELIQRSGLDIVSINTSLSLLEIQGFIEVIHPGIYRKK